MVPVFSRERELMLSMYNPTENNPSKRQKTQPVKVVNSMPIKITSASILPESAFMATTYKKFQRHEMAKINHLDTEVLNELQSRVENQCEICMKILSSKINLRSHMMTHSKNKPYTCVECGNGFTSSNGLAKHKLLHTGMYFCVCLLSPFFQFSCFFHLYICICT